VSVALCLSLGSAMFAASEVHGQRKREPRVCSDIPGQTSGTYRFGYSGETLEIPIRDQSLPGAADCEPVAFDLQWSNGRNNGSNFSVTFRDSMGRPLLTKSISAFMTGIVQFSLASFDAQPMYGSSMSMISIPSTVTIQARPPFVLPANVSYRLVRVRRAPRASSKDNATNSGEETGNEVVSIHSAVRLVGKTRLSLVQVQLKTNKPFPVSDVPLQLQIGKRVFLDELSGDHTGRKLTLSLTPETYAELSDGDEIRAFLGDAEGAVSKDVWLFGKLKKPVLP